MAFKTIGFIGVLLLGMTSNLAADDASHMSPTAKLGEMLFHDVNLSKDRSQSCATCHDPDLGFSDQRNAAAGNAVSLGGDGHSLGQRNAPTATYAASVPPFGRTSDGQYVGGLFDDGRAHGGLADQAAGPPLNPLEMGMPDKAAVVARLKENPVYVEGFEASYGKGIFDDIDKAYATMTQAIAAYERTDTFSTYDSRYDRYLRGEEKFTDQEELGRVLFFSTQFTNCRSCHSVDGAAGYERATFSDNRYFNIGVPANPALKLKAPDEGLGGVLSGDAARSEKGKFRVPTLRNVAVTGPYMHNGVFKDLRTVVLFYNKYNSFKASRQINPETGAPWDPPENPETIALPELKKAPALDDKRIDALVAFLKTLTDKRYEHLLDGEK
jgi:cytochrome c peroxidase